MHFKTPFLIEWCFIDKEKRRSRGAPHTTGSAVCCVAYLSSGEL